MHKNTANKNKFIRIKQFLLKHAEALEDEATSQHLKFLGKQGVSTTTIERYKSRYIKLSKDIARQLITEDLDESAHILKSYGKEFAQDAVKDGLTIQEVTDGVIYLKQVIWKKIKEADLLENFTIEEYFHLSQTIGTLVDTVSSQIAFTYHDYYQQQKEEQAKLLQAVSDAIIVLDLHNKILFWNEGAERMYGYMKEEALGKHASALLQTVFPVPFKEIKTQILQNKSWQGELTHVTKQGKKIIEDSHWEILKGNKILEVNRDVTERREFEIRLQQNEQRFRTLIEKSADAIQLLSPEGKILYSSDSILQVLGYTPEEVATHTPEEYIHHDDYDYFMNKFSQLFESPGKQVSAQYRVKHKNGSWVWVEATGINHLKTPNVNAIVGNFRNITERKLLEQQKDEFLSIASHELKTPVTSLKAYGQVLQKRFAKLGDEKAFVMLNKMDAQISRLANLIQDLLDVSRIEGGRLQFHNEYFYFDELVNEVVEEIQHTTDKHNLVIEGRTGKTIFGDKERIGQVIINLLTNAIKYSGQADKVLITLSTSRVEVKLCVQDFGIGIPEENIPHVFERFYRVSGKTHDTVPGMGLGLYISSEIIKRQGGKIWAESKKGQGSKFCFTLPIKGELFTNSEENK